MSTKQRGHDAARRPAHTLPAESGSERFITCLVTPKISFSLPNKGWQHAQDISQVDLRRAFLARFPMEFDVERVVFTPLLLKQPADKPGLPSRIVFKLGVRSAAGSDTLVDDEHVLLAILQQLDKAYADRHETQLASAKNELLSSCMSFELLADEIRRAQTSAASELARLKDQASSSQKRLYLLELEKEQLQAARASSETLNDALRQRVDTLAAENRELRGQIGGLNGRLEALTQLVVDGASSAAEKARAAADGALERAEREAGAGRVEARAHTHSTANITTQTAPPPVDRVVASMAAWLRQGSELLSLAAADERADACAAPDAVVRAAQSDGASTSAAAGHTTAGAGGADADARGAPAAAPSPRRRTSPEGSRPATRPTGTGFQTGAARAAKR